MKQNNVLEIINQSINSFIDIKRSYKLSHNSLSTYQYILNHFYEFFAEELENDNNLTINNINRYFLAAYVKKMQKIELSDRTQHLYVTVIKDFIKFIADTDIKQYGLLKANIEKFNVKYEQKEAISFNKEEQTRILNLVATLDLSNKFLDNRNSLLLKILLFTGIRISELLNIKWSDIEESDLEYTIRIKGKGNKQRFTYLAKEYSEINIEFLRKNAFEYLLTSAKGNKLDRKNTWSLVSNLLKKAKVWKTGLHIFRHTLGRNLVNDNVNLSIIKEILGHTNITVTAQIYAKADENAKKNALIKNTIAFKKPVGA